MHPYWERIRKAATLGRLAPVDISAWFDVSIDTAWYWLTKAASGRGPWSRAENEHKLGLLERAVSEGRFPLNVSAKGRRAVVKGIMNEYYGGVPSADPAE